MRVVTYNILSGGQARDFGVDRLEAILDVIASLGPDVLALQEANGFKAPTIIESFKRRLGLEYHAISTPAVYAGDGEVYNLVTLSRFPITKTCQHAGPHYETGGLETLIETPSCQISFCNIHLHSSDESARAAEIDAILGNREPADHHIVLGDFNAISRLDVYSDDASEFELRFDVTDRLARDFVDVGARFKASHVPTHPSRQPADHTRKLHRRIDYVFGSEGIAARAQDAFVVKTDEAHAASDHFPVVADFGDE